MKRIRDLNGYQRGLLLLLVLLALVFAVLTALTVKRQGFAYRSAILVPREKGDALVYEGRLNGREASFLVSRQGAVEYRYGETVYGPYTLREDPEAVPRGTGFDTVLRGLELRCGEEIVFRGGVLVQSGSRLLFREDGTMEDIRITVSAGDGVVTDENGRVIDPDEPTASELLELMEGPRLRHRGSWAGWLCGTLLSVVNGATILFADELFRWQLRFRIQNPERAEPSEWEYFSRCLSWTLIALLSLFIYAAGLRQIV